MKRTRLATGLAAGALLALAPAGLAQFSAHDYLESAGTFEAPAAAGLASPDADAAAATFAADATPEAASETEGRPMIGVLLEEGTEAPTIQAVLSDGPAKAAGLKPGDVLVSVGDRFTGDLKALRAALEGKAIGDEVWIGVDRDGESVLVSLTLADSETLDLPDGPEDLEEVEEEEIVEEWVEDESWSEDAPLENEWIEEEVAIELELAELEDLAIDGLNIVEMEDVVLQDLVKGQHQIVVLEDVTHEVDGDTPQTLRLRTVGPDGEASVEVIQLEGDPQVVLGEWVEANEGQSVRLRRNVPVPVAPAAPGACCDCGCGCSGDDEPEAEPEQIQVWTTHGPHGVTMREASKQVDVAAEVAKALRESGIDDVRIAEVLRTLEAHQLDGELSFGLRVGGAAAPRVEPRRVRLEAHGHEHGHERDHEHGEPERVDVSFGWTAEPPHGADHGARAPMRWGVKRPGTNAAAKPSTGYFFDAGSNVEVDVVELHETHDMTERHPLVQRYRIQKPKRPSTDQAEEELERLRAELRALRDEIRELRSAIRARGR